MSRYSSSGSSGHQISYIAPDHYRLYWSVDFYYPSSRLRHPRSYRRDTDMVGAKRFAKKWGISVPEPKP